jgi:acid phosphatase family membrane protein YuiD
MNYLKDLLLNFPLVCAGAAWIAAQIFKIFTGVFRLQKFSVNAMLFGTGGMPSSHTAAVCSLCTACALSGGVGTPWFAISFLLCSIVMRDATGVRYETGKQAKALNSILKSLAESKNQSEIDYNLKELVGHTPLQVFVGAVLGVALPFLMGLIPVYGIYG